MNSLKRRLIRNGLPSDELYETGEKFKEEKELSEASKETVDYKLLYQGLTEFLEIKELMPEIVNKIIKRIEVHSPEKKHSHNCVKIDITFTAIGFFRKEEEQELLHLAKKAQENPQILRQLSA